MFLSSGKHLVGIDEILKQVQDDIKFLIKILRT